ncbi:lytic transglycosylase domain-containing protein [Pantoea agglomerans]|uniref:lytic transglycosylase domain-containing protein n=1 Tax=Enterobacter agglomerans TaxID=549 RepID=UPI00320A391B
MATIIDALVVTLGLDATGFQKGQKDVKGGLDDTRKQSEQTAKDMEAAGKRAASFFGSIRTELLALVGVTLSVQGFKNFITGMTDNLQQLAVNSQSLDMSAKSLDGWQRAAEAAGSSAEKITGNLQAFQNLVTTFRGGGNVQGNPLLMALNGFSGATGAKFDLGTQSSEDIMRTIAANWGKLNKDAQRKFGADVGFDNPTQLALGSGKLVTDADRFTKMSRATEDATRKAQEFNRRLTEMKQNFSAASQVLYEALIPYVEKLIPLIEKFGVWISTHGPEIQKFFSDSASEVNKVVDAVGGWQNALSILAAFVAGSWALKMLAGISRVAGGFGPLLTAIAAVSAWDKLKSNEVEAKKEGKSTGQYLIDKMNSNTGSTDGVMGKADAWLKKSYAWWESISSTGGATNKYDAYGTAPEAKGSGKAMLEWMTPLFSKLETLYKLPSGLLKSVATTESGGNQFAISGAGAKGLFQIMDGTARDLGLKGGDVFDPEKSANAAAKYLSQLLKSNGGDLVKALASYNWGAGNVQRKGLDNAPLETRNYVPKVLAGIQVGAGASVHAKRQPDVQQQAGNKTDIHIGEVTLQTSATTADALGSDLQRKTSRQGIVSAYNTGQK